MTTDTVVVDRLRCLASVCNVTRFCGAFVTSDRIRFFTMTCGHNGIRDALIMRNSG